MSIVILHKFQEMDLYRMPARNRKENAYRVLLVKMPSVPAMHARLKLCAFWRKKTFVQFAQRVSPLVEVRPFDLVLMITTCAIIPASRGRALTVGASTRVIVATLTITAHIKELGVIVVKRHIPGSVRGVAVAHRRIAVHHNFSFPFSVLISVSIIA